MKISPKILIIQFLLLLSFLSVMNSMAQSSKVNLVSSAVPFLRITPDARGGGMGDLGVASSPDVNSLYYNMAKYPFAENKSSLSVNYSPWLKSLGFNDIYLAGVAGYHKLGEGQVLYGSIRYFSIGNLQFTDNLGNELSTFKPNEFSVEGGYSRKLSAKLSLGVGIRYIYSNLAGGQAINGVNYKAGTAISGDVGLFYTTTPTQETGWNFGMALTNLGSKIGYTSDMTRRSFIPANLALGLNYMATLQEVHRVSFGIDLRKMLVPTPPALEDSVGWEKYMSGSVVNSWFSSWSDAPGGFNEEMEEFGISLGAEYVYNNMFSIRGGYSYESPSKGNRQYLTLGTGFNYSSFGFNFSYLVPAGSGINRSPLSNTLRFSFLLNLQGKK